MTTYTSLGASFSSSAGTRMTAFPNSAEMIETAVPHVAQRRLSGGTHSFQDKVYTQNMTTPSNLLGSGRYVSSKVGDPTSYGLATDFFSCDNYIPPDIRKPSYNAGGSLSASATLGHSLRDPIPLTAQTAKSLAKADACRTSPIFTVYDKGTARVFGPGNENMFARDKIFTGIVAYPDRQLPKWTFRASDYNKHENVIPPFIGDAEPGRFAYAGRLSSSDIIKPRTYKTYGTSTEAVYVPTVARYSPVLPISVTRTTSTGLRASPSSFSSHVAPIAAAIDNLGTSLGKSSRDSLAGSRSFSVSTAPGTMRISRNFALDSLANLSVY